MRQRRVRTPNRATAINKPIQRPDTYQRLPEDVQLNSCEQQPVHTLGSKGVNGGVKTFHWGGAKVGHLGARAFDRVALI